MGAGYSVRTLFAIALVTSFALTSFVTQVSISYLTGTSPWSSAADHPNVPLRCVGDPYPKNNGLVLANHHCVPVCPLGYAPVTFDLGYSAICMSTDHRPVSVYDLSGLQVSADNGLDVYFVVPNVPLVRVLLPTGIYGPGAWLSVSRSTLDLIYEVGKLPALTTEVATVGDFVAGTFKVIRIDASSVGGNYTYPYPVCCYFQPRTIHIGDDIGIYCLGEHAVLESIDITHQLVKFKVSDSGGGSCPICLSGDTMIETPTGEVNVRSLDVGMQVWTVDASRNPVVGMVVEVVGRPVPAVDIIIHVALADGRELYASAYHPTADGRTLGQLRTGDVLDGSVVLVADHAVYGQGYTYDLLPSGETGYYWANGILVASTLGSISA